MGVIDKKSPVFDWETGDFVLHAGVVETVTGKEALKQTVLKALQTKRGRYLIYKNVDNKALNHKYGSDVLDVIKADASEAIKIGELKRVLKEALVYDPWIKDVTNINVYKKSGAWYMDCTLKTQVDELELKDVMLSV